VCWCAGCLERRLVSFAAILQIPILGDILFGKQGPNYPLAAIYAPYAIVPLLLVLRMLPSAKPFGGAAKRKAQ
jgi:hypothetical protein